MAQNDIINLLSLLFERNESYHDQKENMIHAGLLIEIGLFTGVITLTSLPFNKCLSLIIYIFLWAIIYSFIRVNSLYKRMAATYRIAYEKALWLCYNNPPNIDKFKPAKKINENNKITKCKSVILFLFPFSNENPLIESDVSKSQKDKIYYSLFFNEILEDSKKNRVGSLLYEIIISIASLVILTFGIVKICKL